MPEDAVEPSFIYKGRILNLKLADVKHSGGRTSKYEIIEHVPCVAVVPICDNGNIMLIKQFRKAVEKELIEIPAGCMEEDETAEETAIRELQEEIGYKPQTLSRIGGFYSSPGCCTEYLHVFIAQKLLKSRLYAEDTDDIEITEAPFEKAMEMVEDGTICDAKTIAALLMYQNLRNKKL